MRRWKPCRPWNRTACGWWRCEKTTVKQRNTNGQAERDGRGRFVQGNRAGIPPGKSGNPAGRPPGRSLTALLRELLHDDGDDSPRRRFAQMLIDEAEGGQNAGVRCRAIAEILARLAPIETTPLVTVVPHMDAAVQTNANRSFIDRVNARCQGRPPQPDDVLAVLEDEG